jgi:7-cyano-7-deazaguanine synthase
MKSGLLLSGGMDSISLAWWKRPSYAFTVDYGQLPAEAEIAAAASICSRLSIEHHVIQASCLKTLGSGDMCGTAADTMAPASDWWPYRNQLLITLSAMLAIRLNISCLWLGTVKSDSGHIDGTTSFIDLTDQLMRLQEGSIMIEAPAIEYSTLELIKISGIPLEQLAWAHSCHKSNLACGDCRGCNKYFGVRKDLGYELG